METGRQVDYDPAKLQELADKLSVHFWNCKLGIPVVWNGRLSRAMGRFMYRMSGRRREPLRIEMSKHAVKFINREIFVAVLLHEMCHYHLFIQDKPFSDYHPLFEQEIERVGAISTNTVKLPEKVYKLSCTKCGKRLGMMKRVNPDNYVSTCCRFQIKREEEWIGTFRYDGQILKNSKVRIAKENL